MDLIFLIGGIILLVLVTIDLLSTILLMNGGGLISNFISKGIWKMLYYISNKNARSPLLGNAGWLIIIVLFATWILMIWMGFSLIYLSDPDSVIDTGTEGITNTFGKIYFVGYTISSLGNGDLKSGSDSWRIFSNVMSIYGTFFITLSISYLIPVLDAVIKKRALSGYIYQLGKTPSEILKNGWNGKDFSILYSHLNNLYSMILEHSERHLAYPILHYFHSPKPKYSAPLTFTILDEAISIQKTFEIDNSPEAINWKILRETLDSFTDVVDNFNSSSGTSEPPFITQDKIGVLPVNNSPEDIKNSISSLADRRRKLHGMIIRDGWKWEDVTGKHND
jgi:hypothetical protein